MLLVFATVIKELRSKPRMGSRKSEINSGDENVPKDRRETLLQRRNRVLGTRSLRYVDSSEKGWLHSFPILKFSD